MKARACATATAAAVGLMILMQSQPTKAESCYGGTLHRWEGRDCEDKVPRVTPHTMPHTIPTTWPLPAAVALCAFALATFGVLCRAFESLTR